MKKVNCVFFIGLILFLNLLSLNSNFSSQSINSLESAGDSAEDPLKVGTTMLGYELDPALAQHSSSIDIIDQVWEGLYAYNYDDPRLRIIPRLAADCGSWNENATVFNVTLRSGITFHNGEAFTAADVNYTFSRLWELCVFHDSELREIYFPYGFNTTKMNASIGYGYIINKTVIVDDLRVSFQLNFPYAPFQSLLCFSGSYIVDESTTSTNVYLEFGNINNGTAIGTGPYKITEHTIDHRTDHTTDHCTFEYWEDYYRGVPAIKEIEFRYISSNTISQALLEGAIDFPRSYDSDFLSEFEKDSDISIGPYREKSRFSYLIMNNLKINRTYRHAINYAIDYNKILNEIFNITNYYGEGKRMVSIVPSGISYHKYCDVPDYDILKSRQILIEAGYTEGHGIDEYSTDEDWKNIIKSDNPIFTIDYLNFLGNMFSENLGLLIKDNLKDIGISVNLRGISTVYFDWGWDDNSSLLLSGWDYNLSNNKNNSYMLLYTWEPNYNDPSQIINSLMSNISLWNYGHVNDSWLQLTMEEALTITNEVERKALYYDIQDYIATDLMPYAFIANSWSRNVRANYVNTQPNPIGKFYIFPFSWHGVNTSFNDPYLELWCNLGSPPILEFWPEPFEPSSSIPGYPMMILSICFLVFIPLWIIKYKKMSEKK